MVPYGKIKSFVLRAGRMTETQQKDYETLRGSWCIPFENHLLNFSDIFENTHDIFVEIGFGMGHATAQIAIENPQNNYIGIEVHRPGVGRLLGEIRRNNLTNLFIIEHDAVEVIENAFPDNSIKGFHIFFPDPWQKKKHHKRRLIKRPFTNLLQKKLSIDGIITMSTDWKEYAEFALYELTQTVGLQNTVNDFAPPQTWRPTTSFEKKGTKANREIYELLFKKIKT